MELNKGRDFLDEHGIRKLMFHFHLSDYDTLYVNIDGSVLVGSRLKSNKEQFNHLISRVCLENGFRVFL